MGEKLTMKTLSGDLTTLRDKVQELETDLERKLEATLEKAAEKLKSRIEASAGGIGRTSGVDTETRRQLISQAAYLRAERRGFSGGSPEQDWLEAEMEINGLLLQQLNEQASLDADRQESPRRSKAPQPSS